MTALAIPQRLTVNRANAALCQRIGIKVDGKDMGTTVIAYDVAQGWVRTSSGTTVTGTIEPYWRTVRCQMT
jgi:hypothetical protein